MSLAARPARTTYPLRALFASPSNVRRKKRTPESIMSLAVSINAHGGVLQNLVVVPELKDGERTGRAGVVAGESRRLALLLLAEGKVPDAQGFTAEFAVPVIEVDAAEGAAASTSENVQREPMHPADQCQAFRDLFEQCGSVEHIAAVFNVTPLVVERRLKLAAASPKLLQLYREDGMSLEQLMALCLTDDHALQEKVWNAARGDWQRNPRALRSAITSEEVAYTSPLARFVGVKTYEQAGGLVRRDLFSDENEGWLADAPLLAELAAAKLGKTADSVRKEGWAWVEVRAEATSGHELAYTRATKGLRKMTDEERTHLQALQAELDKAEAEREALYDKDDSSDEDEQRIDALSTQIRQAQVKLNRMRDALSDWTPEVLAHAGAVVTFGHDGKTVVHRGLVKPEDRKAAAKAAARGDAIARGEDAAEAEARVDAKKPDNKGGLSESLNRRLTAHRTVALQRMLADNTQVALAALAHNMVQCILGPGGSYRTISALDLQARGCEGQLDGATESSIKHTPAWAQLQALREQWGERIPGDHDQLLPWLIRLPMSELCDLLALCAALSLNAVQSSKIKHDADPLAEAVGLDMADWWEPTADEYLNLVPKQLIAQALSESSMSADASKVEKMKKGEAVATAQALLQGKRWLPAILQPRRDP